MHSYKESFENSKKYFGGEELPAKVFLDKYALRDEEGNILEDTPEKMHRRLAKEFSRIENKYPNPMSEEEIFSLIDNFKYIIPQGSPMSAIGNPYHIQSSGNCFSIKPPYDSYGGIFYTDQQLGQLMKRRCVEENTIVNIKNKGNIPIKNVKVGDMILSFNTEFQETEYRKIEDKFFNEVSNKDKIKIELSNGTVLKTSKKHPILLYGENGYFYEKCKNIKENSVCIKPPKNLDNTYYDDVFSDIAWYIGCHIGDGTAGKTKSGIRIRIFGDNEKVIKKYALITNNLADSKALYKKSKRKGDKTICWEYCCNKKTVNNIIEKYFDGMIGKKVYTSSVPSFIKKNNLWIPFISGLIDSDGYIRDYGTIDLSLCSKGIIEEVSHFLSICGISYNVSKRIPKRKNEKIQYRLKIHSNKEILSLFVKNMTHDKKIEKIENSICREFSHKKFISKIEREEILEKYNNILYLTNRYSEIKQTTIEKKSRSNLSSIIALLKKDKNIGQGALNCFLKYDLISQKKYNEVCQRIFIDKIEIDNNASEYIDLKVEGNNNFYAGNFGFINIHNCGVGFNLSNLRPKGVSVKNAARTTDGIAVFMERFSNTCREVAQGGRRGAEIQLLNIQHPEIRTFITIKKDRKKITGSNISIQITDNFMEAVKKDDYFELKWPIDSNSPSICEKVKAREIWDLFIESSWDSAEPGVLFWDTVINNSASNCYGEVDSNFYDTACNPCGEIVMGVDSCRLLAINATSFVENKFTKDAFFNFDKFAIYSQKAQRMMDDMVDLEIELINRIIKKINKDNEPDEIKQIEKDTWEDILKTCINGRRTGLGLTGIADVFAYLNIRYGSEESINITEKIYKTMEINSYKSSCILSSERGSFPIFSFEIDKKSRFLNKVINSDKELKDLYKKHGRRNIAITTTPPAGSISILAQISSGIEPVFSVKNIRRKKIHEGDKNTQIDFIDNMGDKWQEFYVYHKGFKEWIEISGKNKIEESPYYKSTAQDINWESSVDIQAAAQKWICHSISKTCNLPSDATKELVEKVYIRAWEKKCKGFTIYRDGSRSGVLIDDIKKEEKETIKKTNAPKRPPILPCDIYHTTSKGEQYFVLVGMLNNEPYEVFAGKNGNIKKTLKQGNIKKIKRGKYSLLEENGEIVVDDISIHINDEQEAITRLISSNLRHGCDVGFVTHQLEKTKGDLLSFSKALSRCLKKYIPNETKIHGENCEECGGELIRAEGCVKCQSCSWSRCG